MPATVVLLTKLPGHLPVKTRLVPVLGEAGARAFYVEMVRASLAVARAVDPRPVVAYSPPGADPAAALPDMGDARWLPVAAEGGAACLEEALAAAYEGRPLLALGGDAPDLPEARLREAAGMLVDGDADAVFVPTPDGGFSCLGLAAPVAGLGRGFRYGGAGALAALRGFLEGRGLRVALLAPWPDVDTPEDLSAYRKRRSVH